MWIAFAYTDGNGNSDGNCNANLYSNANTEGYAYTTAASHTAASAVSSGLYPVCFGSSRSDSRAPEKP